LLGLVIPADFSAQIAAKARSVTGKVQTSFGLDSTVSGPISRVSDSLPVSIYYHPVLQESFRRSAEGALYSALQLVASRALLRTMYFSIKEKELPDTLE